MLEKSWEFLSKICTPKGDYGRWVKFWFSICRHVCAAVLLVVVAWPTPVNAVLIYAEPPDLGSPLIPTLLGPLGQGNNVISGVVREGPQDGQGDAHDAFRILVPVDKTITSVSFIATGRADHTSGNVSILDSASSVPTTNFNFNNAIVYSPSVPPLTGPRSLEFRTFEVGSSVKSAYSYQWTITAIDTASLGLPVAQKCRSQDPLFFHKSISRPDYRMVDSSVMLAQFTPANGCTLAETAQAYNFDHFNWVNIATEFPFIEIITIGAVTVPFIDPPSGGLLGDFADGLPFYWDEGSDTRIEASAHLSAHVSVDGRTLDFIDEPKDPYLLPFQKMRFVTNLVGVEKNGGWVPLDTWLWASDWPGVIGNVSPRDFHLTTDPGEIAGGISEVSNSSLVDLTEDVHRLMAANGAAGIPFTNVAEPNSIVLVVLALSLLLLSNRNTVMAGRPRRRAGRPYVASTTAFEPANNKFVGTVRRQAAGRRLTPQ